MSLIPTSLPDNSLLGLKEISRYTGVGYDTLNSRVKRGAIPRKRSMMGTNPKLTPKSFWSVRFVRDNIAMFSK